MFTDKVSVTFGGLTLIVFIYWFFFGKKDEAAEAGEALTINVDGGYKPNVIKLKQGKPVKLTFLRKDPNPCLEEVVLSDYKIKEFLPLNKPVTVTLNPPHPKTSEFRCGMNMFHGRIIVEE